MKIFEKKNWFLIAAVVMITATVITSALLILIPDDYSLDNTNEEIKAEMVSRALSVSKKRNSINMVSVTPFMWDEGYYLDNTADENAINDFTNTNILYQKLADDEQRLIFYYHGQLISDLIISKNEIDFDRPPGRIDKNGGWMKIETIDEHTVRLFID